MIDCNISLSFLFEYVKVVIALFPISPVFIYWQVHCHACSFFSHWPNPSMVDPSTLSSGSKLTEAAARLEDTRSVAEAVRQADTERHSAGQRLAFFSTFLPVHANCTPHPRWGRGSRPVTQMTSLISKGQPKTNEMEGGGGGSVSQRWSCQQRQFLLRRSTAWPMIYSRRISWDRALPRKACHTLYCSNDFVFLITTHRTPNISATMPLFVFLPVA